jgi:creatinine amidohydrolase
MLLADMNWLAVDEYLKLDDRIVVITGSCEQHAYLSLATDIRIPLAVAREACEREKALIAPPLPYGISPYFVAYPGTLSLSPETFAAVVRELLEGLLAQGFRRILVSNGHGGNTGVLGPVMDEFVNEHPETKLALFQWWQHPAVAAVAEEAELPRRHANWSENFAFTRTGPSPEEEKPMVDASKAVGAAEFRAALGDGSFGGPYQAPDEVVERVLAAAVEGMVQALKEDL